MEASWSRRLLCAGLLLSAGACDAPPLAEPAPDAGVDSASPPHSLPEPDRPASPALPEPPRLAACPDGWTSVVAHAGEGGSYARCEPPAQLECPPGEAQFLGEATCRRLGTVCPESGLPDEATVRALAPGFDGPLVHVRPGAEDGDGSRDRPWGDVGAALAQDLPEGAIVVLATGSHVGQILIQDPIALVGACPAGTELRPPSADPDGYTLAVGPPGGVLVTNLAVTGDRTAVVVADAEAPVRLRQVLVHDVRGDGLFISDDARDVVAEEVVIRGAGWSEPLLDASGVTLQWGARLTLDRVVLEDNRGDGIYVHGAELEPVPHLELVDTVVRTTQPLNAVRAGEGITVQGAARLEARRLLVEGNRHRGLHLDGSGDRIPEALLEDVVVRGTRAAPGDLHNTGVLVERGARLTLRRGLLEANAGAGVGLLGHTGPDVTTFEATDLVVRDSRVTDEPLSGLGLYVLEGGQATAERAVFDGLRSVAVYAAGVEGLPVTTLRLTDAVLRDSTGGGGAGGRGLEQIGRVKGSLTRVLVLGQPELGVGTWAWSGDPPTTLVLHDVTVRETGGFLPSHGYSAGLGLVAQGGNRLVAERLRIEGSRSTGLRIQSMPQDAPATVALADVTVLDTRESPELSAPDGYGVVVDGGVTGTWARGVVDGATTVGALVSGDANGPDPVLEVESLTVTATRAAPCGELPEGTPGSCIRGGVDLSGGVGLAAVRAASVELSGFLLRDNRTVGLLVSSAATVEARRGVVTANGVGMTATAPDFDFRTLTDEVYIFDNRLDVAREAVEPPRVEMAIESSGRY